MCHTPCCCLFPASEYVCVCLAGWLLLPDLLCFVSHSYFLGELEKCVGDPDSLARLFIKHVSLKISERLVSFFFSQSEHLVITVPSDVMPRPAAVQMCFLFVDQLTAGAAGK